MEAARARAEAAAEVARYRPRGLDSHFCRLQDDAASAASEPTKICSAGCGLAENAHVLEETMVARAVRRCVACVKACVEPKLCTHGKGAFDCAACIAIVKREAEAEVAAEALVQSKSASPRASSRPRFMSKPEQHDANKKYTEAVVVAAKTCAARREGPDVLHLRAGPPLEDEGVPRARV